MRANAHLHRVTSYQTLRRPHNCPHCHCQSPDQQLINRPTSPNNHNYATHSNNYCPSHLWPKAETDLHPGIKRFEIGHRLGVANIYYKRSDRLENASSNSHSDKSFSQKKSNPYIARVNITYTSPEESSLKPILDSQQQFSRFTQKVNQTQASQQKWSVFAEVKQIEVIEQKESMPKVPNILNRRSSVTKKKKENPGICSKQSKKQSGQHSDGLQLSQEGRNRISLVNREQQSSDFLLEREQQILIAMQISRDLKLHYDYYETKDLIKSSNLLHSH